MNGGNNPIGKVRSYLSLNQKDLCHDQKNITRSNFLIDLFVGAVVEAAMNLNAPESVINKFGGLLLSEGLRSAVIQG